MHIEHILIDAVIFMQPYLSIVCKGICNIAVNIGNCDGTSTVVEVVYLEAITVATLILANKYSAMYILGNRTVSIFHQQAAQSCVSVCL